MDIGIAEVFLCAVAGSFTGTLICVWFLFWWEDKK